MHSPFSASFEGEGTIAIAANEREGCEAESPSSPVQVFHVCQTLLTQASPVFERMFTGAWKEAQERQLHIGGLFAPSAFNVFLDILLISYTKVGSESGLNLTPKHIRQALPIAVYYDVAQVKSFLIDHVERVAPSLPPNDVMRFMVAVETALQTTDVPDWSSEIITQLRSAMVSQPKQTFIDGQWSNGRPQSRTVMPVVDQSGKNKVHLYSLSSKTLAKILLTLTAQVVPACCRHQLYSAACDDCKSLIWTPPFTVLFS